MASLGEIELLPLVAATGAVGVAAMGIAEGLKSVNITPLGFKQLKKNMRWAEETLKNAYGNQYIDLLEAMYRQGRGKGDLPRILRQGVRIGLDKDNTENIKQELNNTNLCGLTDAVKHCGSSGVGRLSLEDKNVIGRFEIAADMRIDAALSLAERAYVNGIRIWAFVIAMGLSLAAAYFGSETPNYLLAIFVGLTAVPLAPVVKDITKGLKSASKALGAKI